jgi:hypothetical protein
MLYLRQHVGLCYTLVERVGLCYTYPECRVILHLELSASIMAAYLIVR